MDIASYHFFSNYLIIKQYEEFILSDYQPIDFKEEREDVYRKLKDSYDVLASIIYNGNENVIHRLRAVMALSEIAKTRRLYILDEEKYNELKKEIKEIKKQFGKRKYSSVRQLKR